MNKENVLYIYMCGMEYYPHKKIEYCHLQQYGYTRERQILYHLFVEFIK